MELLKLWRGLFYSMWFSDRPRTQQKLAADLGELLGKLQAANFFPFVDAFWVIMAREWENLDQHRLDKFLMLVRRYVAATLRRLRAEAWAEAWVEDYGRVMRHVPLNAADHRVSNGIRLHVFDVYLDELARVVTEGRDGVDTEADWKDVMADVPVQELLKPIQEIATGSPVKFIRERAAEVLADARLVEWGVADAPATTDAADDDDDDDESEDEWGGFD